MNMSQDEMQQLYDRIRYLEGHLPIIEQDTNPPPAPTLLVLSVLAGVCIISTTIGIAIGALL